VARKVRNCPEPQNGRKGQKPEEVVKNHEMQTFSGALYIRLSKEDGGKQNQNTVENQQAVLTEFIEGQSDIQVYRVYIDNGFSGTDFERPAFQEMMEDAGEGRINCIIVKDLSRFGRNYLEIGNYLENIFPFLNLRFISVTDCFDTFSHDSFENGITIPLKNFINDIYAKDISRKICSALDVEKREGRYGGGVAPYGYRKSKTEKGRYEIDEEAAEVVKYIYQLRMQGYGYCGIADILNKKGIKSPGVYRLEKGIVKNGRMGDGHWKRYAVRDMLHDQVYLGNMVRGKTRSALYKGEKRHPIPKSEWVVVPQTHAPIISREVFDAVQRVNGNNPRPPE